MRQYGAVKGNAFESDRPFLVEKARAIEKRAGEEVASEQLASEPDFSEYDGDDCNAGRCPLCGPRDDEVYWFDHVLNVGVDNRPLTFRLGEE